MALSDHASGNNHPPKQEESAATPPSSLNLERRRSPWPLALVAALFIIMPFLAWYGTWFGRALSDDDIEKYLRDEKPRHVQHALSQVSERMAKGDASARRWYPQIVALTTHQVPDLRMTAAWVMGGDNKSEEFHAALAALLNDAEPIVRRNAALALVRFGDSRGRPELRAMLRPFTVTSNVGGTALTVLTEGTPVKRESMLAKYRTNDARRPTDELRSPLPGKIEKALLREGDTFQAGRELFVLAPDGASVWEALRALYLVGETEDLSDVERYATGVEGMSEEIKRQAALTVEAIKRRASQENQSSVNDRQ
ncbi:MAG TPA: HEAT repeat domain-containing protein [Pyrinomonadaceae bacterium]|jgi:biotin carboxyl carrier protein